MRQCTKCKQELPFSEFYKASGKKSGYKSHCKVCIREQRNAYYKTDEGYKAKIEKCWRDKGINMTVERYDELLASQDGCCAVCGATKNKNGTRLCVDHCHDTGKIRGLLCNDCNTGIGKLGDNKEGLMKALKYLEASV